MAGPVVAPSDIERSKGRRGIEALAGVALLLPMALLPACSKDKPTYGGGFDSPAACIEGHHDLGSDLSDAELDDLCNNRTTDDTELKTCPESLEVLAERNGGGFVKGVDPQYDAAMDWDGDGVSCEQ